MLAEELTQPDWYDNAQCRGTDTSLFFSEADNVAVTIAKSVCIPCPVRELCLEYAIATDQPAGVWGGKTTTERKRIKRRRRVQVA